MKGIKCCGECAYYNMKKHKCMGVAKDPGKAEDSFYADCPHVEAKPVRYGRWIETKYNPVVDTMYCDCNCSNCNFEITREKGRYPKFCENCGARMDAEDINVLAKDGGVENDR